MRYEIAPDGPTERLALWLGCAPLPVIDVLLPLVQVRAVMAAVKLGVFEQLRSGGRSSAELAMSLGLEPEGLELLLRVLANTRYLTKQRGRYALSKVARSSLLEGAPRDLRAYVMLNYAQWRWLEGLETTVQTGRGVDFHEHLRADAETWSTYQRAMLELARPDAELLARRVPVPRGAERLIDLGGGHGLFGAAICRAHPPLKSTVLELGAALPEARRLAEAAGIAEWVTHCRADVTTCDLGEGADVALLCNLLHHFERDVRANLLRRLFTALSPNGTIAIWEPEAPAPLAAPELAGDAVALYFRVTSSAPPVAAAALSEELLSVGFQNLAVHRPLRARGRMLVHARKPRASAATRSRAQARS